jgi:quercetin dioxygenase-like cupin family protein
MGEMKKSNLSEFTNGWFIGDFVPTIHATNDFELAVKRYKDGDTEPRHFQRVATEITVVVEGRCLLGGHILERGDILTIEPEEEASFLALEDCVVVACKMPSIPMDKVLSDD